MTHVYTRDFCRSCSICVAAAAGAFTRVQARCSHRYEALHDNRHFTNAAGQIHPGVGTDANTDGYTEFRKVHTYARRHIPTE